MLTRSRFQPVNPNAIRDLRRQLGWSQAELGKRAGYCERVIRKAEAGGSLSVSTIENLVQTFVSHDLKVTTRELIYSEENLAQEFLDCYSTHGVQMLKHCEPLLSEDFVFNVSAAKSVLPYAGEYHGKEGFQGLLAKFFMLFTRQTEGFAPTILSSKGSAIAHFEERLQAPGVSLPAIWVNLHFQFKAGQISRIDAQFDYAQVMASLKQIQCKPIQCENQVPVSIAHDELEDGLVYTSTCQSNLDVKSPAT